MRRIGFACRRLISTDHQRLGRCVARPHRWRIYSRCCRLVHRSPLSERVLINLLYHQTRRLRRRPLTHSANHARARRLRFVRTGRTAWCAFHAPLLGLHAPSATRRSSSLASSPRSRPARPGPEIHVEAALEPRAPRYVRAVWSPEFWVWQTPPVLYRLCTRSGLVAKVSKDE